MILTQVVDFVVFDDDKEVAELAQELLARRGYDVHISRNQDDVWRFFEEGCRCFILDLTVNEELDGMTVLEMLKEHCPHAFVAILTNHANPRYRELALRLRADAFVIKTADLVDPVDEIFRRMRETESDRDPNHQAFLKLMRDPEWVRKYFGNYVGIVDGRVVVDNPDRVAVITAMERKFDDDVPKYYAKVGEEKRIHHLPTPFPKVDP